MNSRNTEIVELLTSEYTGVYFVNLKTGEATPYSIKASIESEVGDTFVGDVKYTDAYAFCVETLVYNEDKDRMAKVGTVGNIMKELRNKKTFETIYRDNNGKYCEMKFIKMGDSEAEPEIVALCFSEKDEELRAKEEASQRIRKNLEIIDILASEYTSVYYIDMRTDDLDTYTMNEKTENEFGQVFRAGIKYSSAYKMYVNTMVSPFDKEMMLKAGSIYNILDELSDKKSFITRYRNSEGRYCEMRFVKVGNDEFPLAVALCFSDKDDDIKASINRERQQKIYTDLIEDFVCVNYIDIDADASCNTTPYRTSDVLKAAIPDWETEFSFRKRLEYLSEKITSEEERAKFIEETERDRVMDCLEKNLAIYVQFRANIDGQERDYEFKFTADKDDTGHIRGLVAGFHRRNHD